MKALTVKQPWAQLIARRLKPVENRSWRTSYRGPLIIQAGTQPDDIEIAEVERRYAVTIHRDRLHRGVTVALAELVDIVDSHPSPFFHGPFGWVLRNVQPLPAVPLRGAQGLFDPPSHVVSAVRNHIKED